MSSNRFPRRKTARSPRSVSKDRSCISGKMRYRSKPEAIRALHLIQNSSRADKIPQRAYECEACKGWHLTSSKGI